MKKAEKSLIIARVQKAETCWAAAEYFVKSATEANSEDVEGCKLGAHRAWAEYMTLRSLANDLGVDVPSASKAAMWWRLSNTL